MRKPVRKVVFPVAGLGTRFLPATKAIPKEMLPLVDRPLLQHAVEEARAAGIEDFVFVTGRSKRAIEDHFDADTELNRTLEERGKLDALEEVRHSEIAPGRCFYTRQQVPLGLGHAVWCARALIGNDPFAIVLPDDYVQGKTPCLKQMVEAYEEVGGNIVAVVDVPRERTSSYGILDVEKDDGRLATVRGLVEKPKPEEAPSTLSIIGRYILQPEIFDHLEKQQRGTGNEIQLTDAMAKLIGNQPFHGLRFEGTRYDCGDKVGFIEATLAHALNRPDMADKVREMLRKYC
ncbi:UTP--glucose-1-phosphate uridylyltransferase GalU (plasmid) [Azospirillum oryzae]|uniref:UTP--glucose-1-phosphate uridylyltransferase n=1 Tax=Azospirillum oryzae TaxID=286727 RepID=A0A6N1APF9_9PROT|nr:MULTISPECIES: UTP--glucose-1-phosphate uridylyltransferase GalU [Azospirillum]KAA0577555.1 UTP--glucose-1-phosphate uridylyltransferase GalU [Azospirillum sp. Sh1]KAA0588674.1 UTP--glucose-1-phosphate uridylyltransferase GalU [Azospirillum oryzae]QKS50022.1 UTP--glucose-1-phosphate uridylyltransferase GalU [Azospirillum oryzae]GLR82460.1 UTP--glucose-1-phosphate uridylyltransferase [Azospirillum oryzae]